MHFLVLAALLAQAGAQSAQSTRPTSPPTETTRRLTVPPKLADEVAPLLHGLEVNAAARGFRTLSEFVTVLYVAENLAIPFPTLKKRVVTERIPLDIAVRRMRPGIDAKKEIARAEHAADVAIKNGG